MIKSLVYSLVYSLLASLVTTVILGTVLPDLAGAETTKTNDRFVAQGFITDATTGQPIGFATVRVVGTGQSTVANEAGAYRVVLHGDSAHLKFSHIAHYSEQVNVARSDSLATVNVRLRPAVVDVGEIKVYTRAYDPAQRIILEAMKRKQDILTRLHDYQYDAYVKLVVDDITDPTDPEIFMLTESQVTASWEYPDKYKEVITARRQTANLDPENNLVTVGEILNFNANRIELGRYSVVTPTAKDALDHYNYYLVDTVWIDSLRVFKLEVEPKNPDNPLFVGFIHIADSTYDVVEVDVGLSRGFDLTMVRNPRYSQRFAQYDNEYWMPVEIRLAMEIKFSVPLPFLPSTVGLEHVASLHDYQLDKGIPKGVFNEYVLEVEREADDVDSSSWSTGQRIPLTDGELAAYAKIDSVESEPPSIGEMAAQVVGGATFAVMMGVPDFFRYNRVEGVYLGAGGTFRQVIPDLDIRLSTGYAFAPKRWLFDAGVRYRLTDWQKCDVGFDGFHTYGKRETFTTDLRLDPSFENLMYQWDPFDYYRTRGFEAYTAARIVNQTRLKLTYHDSRDFSAPVLEDYAVFRDEDNEVKANPPIADGRLRSLRAELLFDTRDLILNKGVEDTAYGTLYSQFAAGTEIADPNVIDNDFDYRRYWASAFSRFRTAGLGVTSIKVFGGLSEGSLPPQRYFTASGTGGWSMDNLVYYTFDERSFSGSRAAGFLYHHNFYRTLWVKSGFPLIQDIPFWLTTHGGIFWSDFHDQWDQVDRSMVSFAEKSYREFGVGLANLTPFLSPFNFYVNVTWQASDYATSDWAWSFGLSF